MRLCRPSSLIQPTGLFQVDGCCLEYTFSLAEWCKDPAPLCRDLPCATAGSSVQSPSVPIILLKGCQQDSINQHSYPSQGFGQIQGTVGLPSPQSRTPPPSVLSQSLWGRRLLWGRSGCEENRERKGGAENQSFLQLPPLFLRREGRKGPWLSS